MLKNSLPPSVADRPTSCPIAGFLHLPVVVGYLVGLAQVVGGLAILSERSGPPWRGVRHRRHARSDLFGAPPLADFTIKNQVVSDRKGAHARHDIGTVPPYLWISP